MAKYTVEVQELRASGFDFGMADYPIFNEDYREGLNTKILDHYNFKEIGAETTGRWKFMLNRELREIMPYFNQLYVSAQLPVLPLLNSKVTTTTDKIYDTVNGAKVDGTLKREGTNGDVFHGRNVHSDTPANLLSVANIEGNIFATDADVSDNTNTNTIDTTDTTHTENEGTNKTTDKGTVTIEGFTQAQSELLIKYRQTFLNIDMQVIDALADLFITIW